MNKIWLIIQREYLTRVRSRAFLLATLLTPLVFGAFIGLQALFINYKGSESKHVVLLDEGRFVKNGVADTRGVRFSKAPPTATLDALKDDVRAKKYDGILRLPPLANLAVTKQTVFYYSDEQLSPEIERAMQRTVEGKIRDFKIDSLRLNRKSLDELDTDVSLDPEPIDKEDKNASTLTSGVAIGISFIIGLLMYIIVLMYGSMVMRSVMEEKTNRIVEVMMSSVRPFELMLGKIIGSAGVGTTQLIIWAILNTLVFIGVSAFLGVDAAAQAQASPLPGAPGSGVDVAQTQEMLPQILAEISRQNWWYIVIVTILFFIGGYFLYASLFAALGSAVGDDMGEGQSLTFPVMLPIIIAFFIMSSVVMRAPNSPLAVFASLFPLFSPIVMPGRLAFDPPLWQVGLSIAILIGTAVFFVWLSARIYRVGILMYGKKVTTKELWKWMFYKG
jgi:ABC-2 type transport system permease protein